jgi:hypothetical protein
MEMADVLKREKKEKGKKKLGTTKPNSDESLKQ